MDRKKDERFRAEDAEKPVINEVAEAVTSDQYLAASLFTEESPRRKSKRYGRTRLFPWQAQ